MKTKILITPADKGDIKHIIGIQKDDGFKHAYFLQEKRILTLLKRGEKFFLATINGQTVGFASFDPEIRAKIHFLSVHKQFSRQGVGSLLMNNLLNAIKSMGYDKAYCYVEKKSSIESFLIKFNFYKVGEYKNRYGDKKDASIWEISLK